MAQHLANHRCMDSQIERPLFRRVPYVAEVMHLDERTVRRGIERGEIPAVRIGNAIRIPDSWVRKMAGLTEDVSLEPSAAGAR